MVATHHQCDQTTFDAFGRLDDQRLDGLLDVQAVLFDQRGDGLGVRRVDQLHLLGRCRALRRLAQRCRQRFTLLDVGGEIGAGGEGDGVFTGGGQHVEFVGAGATDGAVVGDDGTEVETQAREDAHVGVVHHLIGLFQGFFAQVEGVTILHHELA